GKRLSPNTTPEERQNSMRSLVGSSMEEADRVTFAELQVARIPAYQGRPSPDRVRFKEIGTSVVGVLQFAQGQLLVLERSRNCYSVRYHLLIEREQALRIENNSGKTLLWLCSGFDVFLPEGLDRLIRAFESEYGAALPNPNLETAASMCGHGLADLRRL